jgi:hypothetical protein
VDYLQAGKTAYSTNLAWFDTPKSPLLEP